VHSTAAGIGPCIAVTDQKCALLQGCRLSLEGSLAVMRGWQGGVGTLRRGNSFTMMWASLAPGASFWSGVAWAVVASNEATSWRLLRAFFGIPPITEESRCGGNAARLPGFTVGFTVGRQHRHASAASRDSLSWTRLSGVVRCSYMTNQFVTDLRQGICFEMSRASRHRVDVERHGPHSM
jgi:hypothetical protein